MCLKNGCPFIAFFSKDTNFGSNITISETKYVCNINIQCAIQPTVDIQW